MPSVDWSDISPAERAQVVAHIRSRAWRMVPGWWKQWLRILLVSVVPLIAFEVAYLWLADRGIVRIGMFDRWLPAAWTHSSFRWLTGASGVTLAYGLFFLYVVGLPWLLRPFFLVRWFYRERVAEALLGIGRCPGCGYRLATTAPECPECGCACGRECVK